MIMDSLRIPLELIGKICESLLEQGHHQTLAAFLPCSRDIYALVAPLLYRRVTLTRANAKGFFSGLATPPDRLRRGRRRVRSAPSDISWGRFKSRDFYLEWASIYESAPDESLRSRREYFIWPNAEADSGEEDDDSPDEEGGPGPIALSPPQRSKAYPTKLAWPHPTRASHARKVALLEHIRYLHISELPSFELSETLQQMARSNLLRFPERKIRVSIGPKAFWKLVDWSDRHASPAHHPFFTVLERIHIQDLCIQYPVVDQALEINYMSTRIVTNEEHLSRGASVDQYTYLRFRLAEFLQADLHDMARDLCGRLRANSGQSMTIHNVAGNASFMEIDNDKVKGRWWVRPCCCQDVYLSNPVQDTACYNHVEPAARRSEAITQVSWLLEAYSHDHFDKDWLELMESNGKKSDPVWELIDFDWETGKSQPMQYSARWENMEEYFWVELRTSIEEHTTQEPVKGMERARHKVVFKNSVDAEPCVCCGKGHLSYEESTIA